MGEGEGGLAFTSQGGLQEDSEARADPVGLGHMGKKEREMS